MRIRVLLLFVATSLGCAGRDVPVRFADQSALSPGAREAPVSDPAVALGADPPLPGEAIGAWTGLAADGGAPAIESHAHAH
jgi:hypothetical protein